MMFTVEEMNLIRAMDHTCRRMAIFDIKTSIPNIEDHELKELCEKTLGIVKKTAHPHCTLRPPDLCS